MAKRKFLWGLTQVLAAFLGVTQLTGCASVKPLLQVDPNVPDSQYTLLLLNVEFAGPESFMNRYGPCELRLKNETTDKIYSVSITPQTKMVLVEPPGGQYHLHELSCSPTQTWELLGLSSREIALTYGKVNFAGKVHFRISPDAKTLTARFGVRKEVAQALEEDWHALSKERTSRLVSGYTGKEIHAEMLPLTRGDLRSVSTHTYLRTQAQHMKLEALDTELAACDRPETTSNPARLGTLAYDLTFQDAKLVDFKKVADRNTFSPTFENCIEHALQGFRATGIMGKAELKIVF